MSYYGYFADYYDRLNAEHNYEGVCQYYEKIFEKYKIAPEIVCDLGCGSGGVTIPMAKLGYDMIGIDLSEDMLSIAAEKSKAQGVNPLYLNQDMCDFELYGTVDAFICALDGINYITNKRDLKRCFKLANLYLNPNGIFIFDINTKFKFENTFANNTFVYDMEDVFCVWQNNYDKRSALCEFQITIFGGDGELKRRYDETHIERCYTVDELVSAVEGANFKVEGIFDDQSFKKEKENSQRLYFVVRKK